MKRVRLALTLFMILTLCFTSMLSAAVNASEHGEEPRYIEGIITLSTDICHKVIGIREKTATFSVKLRVEPEEVVYQPGGYIEFIIDEFKLANVGGYGDVPVTVQDLKICMYGVGGKAYSAVSLPISHEFKKVGEVLPERITARYYYDIRHFFDLSKENVPGEFVVKFWICGGDLGIVDTLDKDSVWDSTPEMPDTISFRIRFLVEKPKIRLDIQPPSEVSVNKSFDMSIKVKNVGEMKVELSDIIFTKAEDLTIDVMSSGSGILNPGEMAEYKIRVIPRAVGLKKLAFSIPYTYLAVIKDELQGEATINVVKVTPQDAEQMIAELEKLKAELEPKLKKLSTLYEELNRYSKRVNELYTLANQIQAKLKDLEQKYGELSQKVGVTKTIQVTTTQTFTGKPSIPAGQPASQTQQEILPKMGYNELLLMLLGATLTGVIIAIALAAVAIRRGGRK